MTEVDLVLSTTELMNFLVAEVSQKLPSAAGDDSEDSMKKRLVDLSSRFRSTIPMDPVRGTDSLESLFRCASADATTLVNAADENVGSGGYLEYLFRYANEQLYGLDLWSSKLEYTAGRNEDIAEVTTSDLPDVANKLVFAKAYGFRNIQSVIMKMKSKRCKYHFVEIMACPKGCINGGGQLKAADKEGPADIKERTDSVSALLHSGSSRRPEDSPLVRWLYGPDGINASPGSSEALRLLHTRYHAIPKLEQIAPLVAKW